SQADIRRGACDAVVYFTPDFAERVASRCGTDRLPESEIIYDSGRDKSRVARQRIEAALMAWRQAIAENLVDARSQPATTAHAFDVKQTDVAPAAQRRVALWSKILPFVVLIWALTGAFYPAVDLCAGEKER